MTSTRAPAWVLLALLLAVPALADWHSTMPAKWVQYPDLSPTGIDINASPVPNDYILADDFECTETGPITGIHIWGSWLDDYLPFQDAPEAVVITLSLHADIPADVNPDGFSIPGDVLWMRTFQPGEFIVQTWEEGILEGWMNPPEDYIFPGDTVCWQYNFTIPETEAFVQLGTAAEPVVYWLDVKAEPMDPMASFGWKTSLDHWNDDAVFGFGDEPYFGPWRELIYPPMHEMAGQSIDLAFVIQGVEQQDELDFGDAPDPAGAVGYPTWLTNDGARHVITPNVYLGASIDAEPDGQPDPNALGDDNDGNDDEDGVVFTSPFVVGQTATFDVTASVSGTLWLWIDYNINGNWTEANELVFAGVPVNPGVNNMTVTLPTTAAAGQTFARFRYTTSLAALTYTGAAPNGEVEDYEITIEEIQESLDWGDAPEDPTGAPSYNTTALMNGPSHVIQPGFFMGASVDPESNGQPTAMANGDDIAGSPDDEDGVIFTTPLFPGVPATVEVTVSAAGFVDAWLDFDADMSWLEPQDYILPTAPVSPGVNSFTFMVPAGTTPEVDTFARFRFSSSGGLPPDGPALDGEVEDHLVRIEDKYVLKWIQHPDLSMMGIDIAAGVSPDGTDYLLADDFLCTQTGPLTDFHIWGSWLGDYLPFGGDPHGVRFVLSIHKDIPAGQVEEYSMPGEVLWWHEFGPEDFEVEPYAEQIEEGWMDPPDSYIFPADWTCWLYKFHIDPHRAFIQEGSESEPVVYWLDLKAYPFDQEARFGWKTSLEHWNDDAVWGLGEEPYAGPWFELRYPPMHEMWGQSIDLAFAVMEDLITDVPEQETPERVGLRQNVPNPFNPITEIAYELPPGGAQVDLVVYDVQGRRVRNLVSEYRDGGPHTATWNGLDDDGRALPTGVYFAYLHADGRRMSVKMVLLR